MVYLRKYKMNLTLYMKIILVTSCLLLLFSCGSYGTKFFINNYHSETVSVEYKYFDKGEYADSIGFTYEPKTTIMLSDEIVSKKIIKKYPFYNTKEYFKPLIVSEKANLTFNYNQPPNSTISIAPIHQYGTNIEYIIVNNLDTLWLTNESYDLLIENKLALKKYSFIGNSYILINLNLSELNEMLRQLKTKE